MRRLVTEKASGRAVAAQAALAAVEHHCRLSLRSFVPVARRLCGCTRWWVGWERRERGERPRLLRAGGGTGGASSSSSLLVGFFTVSQCRGHCQCFWGLIQGHGDRLKKKKNKVQKSCEVLSLWF